MRPIKFRIVSTKTTQNKILGKEEVCETGWYHKYINQPTSEGPVRGMYERNQFTGRLDSNGEEVYEGDLIQTMDNVFEVKYDGTRTAFTLVNDKGTSFLSSFDEIKVVGNTYEK